MENITKANKPAHEIRIGGIKATIWENQGQNGPFHSVTFARLYRAGEEWKQSASFQRDDLLVLAKVADMAHSWITEQVQKYPEREEQLAMTGTEHEQVRNKKQT